MDLDPSILAVFCVSEHDIQSFTESNSGLAGIDISRLSRFLLVQLTSAWKHRTINTFAITDLIQQLEGRGPTRSSTAKPRLFKHKPLRGLWKVHFFDPRFLMHNISNQWGLSGPENDKFDKLCARVAAEENENPSAVGWQGKLAHELVLEGYQDRAAKRKLTGEWLIFGVQEQKNVYLALCTHSDGPEQDSEIYNALLSLCGEEFPEVFATSAGAE
ncbi:hypothetical protein R69619_05431 [Paraburkholderia nemoris]|uniref:hypothetical protein n=1 Tax=Paraburkholderia nemoris TaxID=2793076 RepID=UPI00190B6F97|nr:hypothetical protein [Paraburkholderia nemoris]MBK3738160.1 hypothetical protein [Paraburkholderia aspalathi]CAE6806007.1 hypothetical protein R69619_05431 [Paraburkholderia nemoris]